MSFPVPAGPWFEMRADAAVVNVLARLALLAKRLGREIEVRNASPELVELIVFMGLGEVLLGVEPRREAE